MTKPIKLGDRRPPYKAGARHSAADTAMVQQIAELAAALGAGSVTGASEPVTDASVPSAAAPAGADGADGADVAAHLAAIQATSVTDYYESVRRAIYDLPAMPIAGGGAAWPDCIAVHLGNAIIRFGNRYYRVAFSVTDNKAVLAPWMEWVEVKQEWVIKALTAVRAIKAEGDGDTQSAFTIGSYAAIFGASATPDLYNDFFTADTDFWLDEWSVRPMLYHHALDDAMKASPVVGKWIKAEKDAVGVWVEGVLNQAHEYAEAIKELVKKGVLRLSSDSAPHLVERKPSANKTFEITRWPIFAVSLTPTPAEPRLAPVSELKAAYKEIGQPIPNLLTADAQLKNAKADAVKAPQGASAAQSNSSPVTPVTGSSDGNGGNQAMKTLAEILDAAERAALDGKLDEAKALQERASTLKSIQDMKAAQPVTRVTRPPFADGNGNDDKNEKQPTANAAVKSWYVKRFGELDKATEQLARELYADDYQHLTWRKNADFRRFLRTGEYDPALKSLVLLTPGQIMEGVFSGLSIGEIKATMVEAIDSLGGYLVPEDFRSTLIERLPGKTVVRSRANVMTTSRDVLTMTKVTGGTSRYKGAARVKWVDETPAAGASETNATFGPVAIPIHTVMATVNLSRNLLEDVAINLDSYLAGELSTASAIDEDEKFLVAAGAGTPLGVLPGGGAPTDPDITTVNSGNASALTADGVVKMPFGLPAQYRQAGGTWVFNKATAQTIALLKDSQNRYLWASNNDQMSAARPAQLLGYEVAESEAMPSIAANAFPIIFADWKGYTIADRIGMSLERYIDSYTAETNTVKFVMRRRLGGQLLEGWRFVVQKVAA